MARIIKTNIVNQIKDIVDSNNPNKQLGNVKINTPQQVFKFRPTNLSSSPKDPKKFNNIIWRKVSYQHDRGLVYTDDDFNLIAEFNRIELPTEISTINSVNGNFFDSGFPANSNILYYCTIDAFNNVTVNLSLEGSQCCISIFHKTRNGPINNVFNTENALFFSGNHKIALSKGLNKVYIVYYRQSSGGSLRVKGDLGSFAKSVVSRNTRVETKPVINQIKSSFLDGRYQPTLVNSIEIPRIEFDSNASDGKIQFFRIYREETKSLDFNTVSGWGDDGFAVDGSKASSFPIAGTAIFGSEGGTQYKVSGTSYNSDIDQTIVFVSGTLSDSVDNQPIFMLRLDHKLDVRQTRDALISGVDSDVVAGTSYKYRVSAVTEDGNESDFSDAVSVTAADFTAPGQVSNLTAIGSLKAVELNWTNPDDKDIKGIHIWGIDNPSDSDDPIQTLLKGTTGKLPKSTVVTQTTSGTLIDDWPYTFYVSTFDWAGNENTTAMPNASDFTKVVIQTKREGQRIETDTDTNQLRFYNAEGNLSVKIGEDIFGEVDGLAITDGTAENRVQTYKGSIQNFFSRLSISGTDLTAGEDTRSYAYRGVIERNSDNPVGLHGINISFVGNPQDNDYAARFVGATVYSHTKFVASGTAEFENLLVSGAPVAVGILPSGLNDLSDVSIDTPSTGHILAYNATSEKWENNPDSVLFESTSSKLVQEFYRNQVNELSDLGEYLFTGLDENSNKTTYAYIRGVNVDHTDGSESGGIQFWINDAGTERKFIQSTGKFVDGFEVASATTFNPNSDDITFEVKSTEGTALFVSGTGGLGIGTSIMPTLSGTNVLVFGDNEGDPELGSNTAGLYAKDISGTVQMFAVDEAGNNTQISPHDPTSGEWVFFSRNTKTGKTLKVNMEKLVRLVEGLTGENIMEEFIS